MLLKENINGFMTALDILSDIIFMLFNDTRNFDGLR